MSLEINSQANASLEFIKRMLGYLGWAAHDSILLKWGFERVEIKHFSELISDIIKDSGSFSPSKKQLIFLSKILRYFEDEEKRWPGNLHTLTGFNPELLAELIELIEKNKLN